MGMQIDINGLQKRFGDKTAVSIDNLRIESGELIGIVGNNGAGKTTLFRLILDLVKADAGCVMLMPQDAEVEAMAVAAQMGGNVNDRATETAMAINPAKSEEWKQFTGAYIDDGFLIDFLTPEEYFGFVGKANGLAPNETEKRLKVFATFMGGEICGQKKLIRSFSAGNKQKIGIIAAMLNHPQLLVLDEPFSFLDPTSQHVLKSLLADYNRATGATVLVSSHNLSHTVDISSRVVLLEHGSVVKDLPNIDRSAASELSAYFDVG